MRLLVIFSLKRAILVKCLNVKIKFFDLSIDSPTGWIASLVWLIFVTRLRFETCVLDEFEFLNSVNVISSTPGSPTVFLLWMFLSLFCTYIKRTSLTISMISSLALLWRSVTVLKSCGKCWQLCDKPKTFLFNNRSRLQQIQRNF